MIEFDRSSLRQLIEENPSTARVLEALDGHLAGVHLVGGSVRDLLLGREPRETDLVVEGSGREVATRLAGLPGGRLEFHDRFATATVTLPDWKVDVATARSETYPTPGSLPEVLPADLTRDLQRRDFTVNAIAVALDPKIRGQHTSVGSAVNDLRNGLLRVLHPESFEDDPTRLWRLARYAGRLGFRPEPETAALAAGAVAGGALETVSPERHGAELVRSADPSEPDEALSQAAALGLFEHVGGSGFDSARVARAAALLGAECDREALRVAACFCGSTDSASEAVRRLALPQGLAACAIDALETRRLVESLDSVSRPSGIARLFGPHRAETVALAGAARDDQTAKRWFDEIRHVACPISGADLLAAGVVEGPLVAVGLDAALTAALDAGARGHGAAMSVALAAIAEASAR